MSASLEMDFLSQLNPVQRRAAEHAAGPLLIIAGAGSGKTRVLTSRIAYLIAQGISPMEILAVTFTNKAAGEMRQRVARLVGEELYWIGTFHSICVKILRRHAAEIGYLSTFTIYDEDDQIALVKECLKELSLDPKDYKPSTVLNAISRAKDSLIDEKKFAEQSSSVLEEVIGKVYALYEKKLKMYHAFDFGDLITKTVYLFQEKPQTLAVYQEKFKHVLVDEYQDTNHAQYMLVRLLSEKHKNICVVGDPDQSIYRWRGADIRNILDFERDFEGTAVVKLEQNYRSTKNILAASNHLIRNNRQRREKDLWTDRDHGEKLTYYIGEDEQNEAQFLVNTVQAVMQTSHKTLRDMVVFYRVHAQSRVLENALRRAQIPYAIIGGVSFYARKEIKDVMSYLKAAVEPNDNISLKRIVNVPARGIGGTSLDKIEAEAAKQGVSLFEMLKRVPMEPFWTSRIKKAVVDFVALIEGLRAKRSELPLTPFLLEALKASGYVAMLENDDDSEAQMRLENVRELISATEEFEEKEEDPTLERFLELMTLASAVDTWQDETDQLSLMTLHCAKGLEFPVVFMVGMEEDLFPLGGSDFDPDEIEEERRLCYVGITRAKEKVFLSGVNFRRLYGERKPAMPSRFLSEIPREFLEVYGAAGLRRSAFDPEQAESAMRAERPPKPVSKITIVFNAGDRVIHPEFGVGRVQEVIGEGEGLKYSVMFGGVEPKLLSAKYARLTKYV